MKGTAKQKSTGKKKKSKRRQASFCRLIFAFCNVLGSFLVVAVHAADLTPPRVFFSDAKLSVEIPDGWNIGRSFPYGPLFTHVTSSGTASSILCAISAPIDSSHMASDTTAVFLENFAHADLAERAPHATILGDADRTIAARHAYDITWQETEGDSSTEFESEYFFNENRVYALTLKTKSDNFPALAPNFQAWLPSVRFLSRRAHGQLDTPAHGGLWIHQTGGARVLVPSAWLIGVADDQQMGATFVSGDQHASWTLAVDPTAAHIAWSDADKKGARAALEKADFKVMNEAPEPFHDLPGYHYLYEGKRDGRFVKGEDIYIVGPQGRWLFSIEADGSLYNKMEGDFQDLRTGIQFLEAPKL